MAGLSQSPCIPLKEPARPLNSYRDPMESLTVPPFPDFQSYVGDVGPSLVRLMDASPRVSVISVQDMNDNSISGKSSVSRGTSMRLISPLNRFPDLSRNSVHDRSRELRSVSTLSVQSRGMSTGFGSPMRSADELSGTRRPVSLSFQRGKVVGSGGFGTVYQAILSDGSLAAVKEMKLETNVKTIDREVRALSSLPPHPHCVRYIGSRHSRHHYYIIMEYISGGSIQSLRATVGRFREPVMQRYARMVLLGLEHLHSHGIIHRDIKGANVLLDEKGCVKIVDFGCCKDLNLPNSTFGTGGTPLWMAPEVCRGEAASEKSDVWAFGCLCLEMCNESGLPWSFPASVNIQGIAYAIASAKNSPTIPSDLSPFAQDLIRCCLQIDPDDRLGVDELLQHAFFSQDYAALDSGDDELVCSREPSTDATQVTHSSTLKVSDNNAAHSNNNRRFNNSLKRKNSTKQSVPNSNKNQLVSVNQGFMLEVVNDDDDDDDDDDYDCDCDDVGEKRSICGAKVAIKNGVASPLSEQAVPFWMCRRASGTAGSPLLDKPRSPSTSLIGQRESHDPLLHRLQQHGQEQELDQTVKFNLELELNSAGFDAGSSSEDCHGSVRVFSPLESTRRPFSRFSPCDESGGAVTPTQTGNSGDLGSTPAVWVTAGSDNVIARKKYHMLGGLAHSPYSCYSTESTSPSKSASKSGTSSVLKWLK